MNETSDVSTIYAMGKDGCGFTVILPSDSMGMVRIGEVMDATDGLPMSQVRQALADVGVETYSDDELRANFRTAECANGTDPETGAKRSFPFVIDEEGNAL